MSDDWTTVSGGGDLGTFIRWTEEASNENQEEATEYLGDEFVGKLVQITDDFGKTGDSTVYTLDTEEHGKVSFYDSKVLRDGVNQAKDKFGIPCKMRVKCNGKKKSKKGNEYWDFHVQAKGLPMEDMAGGDEDVDPAEAPF